jgi:hypothetical protein
VSAIHLGYEAAEPAAAVASLLVLGAMLIFAFAVFRTGSVPSRSAQARLTPAE